MKKVVLYGGIILITSMIYSCKKEIICPNNNDDATRTQEPNFTLRGAKSDATTRPDSIVVVNNGTDNTGGGITDPNDDDYSKKRPSKFRR